MALTKLIGFSNDAAAPLNQSDSGYFVDQLPGISEEMALGSVHGSVGSDLTELWNKVQANAQLRIETDFKKMLAARVTLKHVLFQSHPARRQCDASPTVLVDGIENGIEIQVPESDVVEIFIRSIVVYAAAGVSNQVIRILDYYSLDQLDSFELEVDDASQRTVIPVMKAYAAERIKIVFGDGDTGNAFYELDVIEHEWTEPCDCNAHYFVKVIGSKPLLWADFFVSCSLKRILDTSRLAFTEAYQNLLGSELLKFKKNAGIASKKVNYFTSSNLAQTEELIDLFANRYKEALLATVASLDLSDAICYPCGENFNVEVVSSLP